MKIQAAILVFGMVLLGLGAMSLVQGRQAWSQVSVSVEPAGALDQTPEAADRMRIPMRIRPGGSFGEIAQQYGLPSNTIREAALRFHDLADIRPGHDLHLEFEDGTGHASKLVYAIDEDRVLAVSRAQDGSWDAALEEVVYEESEGAFGFKIGRSLWQDGLEAGLRPRDLVRLAQIFEYELDFNTELKAGASLALLGVVQKAPGKRPRLGAIHTVRFQNGDQTWTAVRWVHDDDREGYYRPNGESMQRPFLRSPLKFSRVTSGFNPRRYHPVLKRRRPHNGTDFGAPRGTPVRSVADGRVVMAGRNGGHGNFVKVRHDNGYDTSYSHLSSIAVRRGQTVQQGQLVGKVGSTGMSTGPHLHYQMWKNGRFVDAMKIKLPNQAPLTAKDRPAFADQYAKLEPRLEAAWRDVVGD